MSSLINIFISLFGGSMPILIWLWFWLREDNLHPEPRSRIAASFFAGMIAVLLVLPIQKFIYSHYGEVTTVLVILLWVVSEELMKYFGAYFTSLRNRVTDEPIDAVIYMISSALGFSALENSLFLTKTIEAGLFAQSIINGNMRFIGATLLHTTTSAIIGIAIGFSFYKAKTIKKMYLFLGLSLAIILHTAFNLLIIKWPEKIFMVFASVWFFVAVIILAIEKIKSIRN